MKTLVGGVPFLWKPKVIIPATAKDAGLLLHIAKPRVLRAGSHHFLKILKRHQGPGIVALEL